MKTYEDIAVGDCLPELALPAVTRSTLALFAGASGDHNPIHIDLDFARRAGMPDVFAHGMLGMAWLGRMLTAWLPQSRLREFGVRFGGITHLGHVITCSGKVVSKDDARRQVRVEIRTTTQFGEQKIAGDALVDFAG